MHKKYVALAAGMGALGVALGAFGAHGLERMTADPKILQGFRTGVQYQVWHALLLLVVAIVYDQWPRTLVKWSANCIVAGVLFFSGSLYLLTFLKIRESAAVKMVGPVTPLGGLLLILGWVFLLLAVLRHARS